jgi:hypothetical protein
LHKNDFEIKKNKPNRYRETGGWGFEEAKERKLYIISKQSVT